jgi:alanyl-tRNA synthetase
MELLEAATAQGLNATMSGAAAFELYDTYGFPLEITQEMAAERGIQVHWTLLQAACLHPLQSH